MRFLIFFLSSLLAFSYDLVVLDKKDSKKLDEIGFVCEKQGKKYVCLSSNDLEELKKVRDFLFTKFNIKTEIIKEFKQNPQKNLKKYKNNKAKKSDKFCIQILSFKNLTNAKRSFNKYKNYPFARVENIEGFYVLRVGEGSFDDIYSLKEIIKKGIVRRCDIKKDRIVLANFKLKSDLEEASELIAKGEYKKAKELLEKIYLKKPNNIRVLIMLGDIYLRENNLDNALNFYKNALLLSPNSIKILKQVEEIYIKKGKYEEALKYSNKLISLGEKDKYRKELLKKYYWVLAKKSDSLKEKEKYLKKLLEVDENADVLIMLGDIATQQKKYNVAYVYYSKAYSLNPKNFKAGIKFVDLLLKLKLFAQAEIVLENLEKLSLNEKEKKELKKLKKMF